MRNKFFSVGITGGIGSGKSLICKIFNVLGISVYSSDERAKSLLSHDPLLKDQLIQEFGQEAYDQHGRLNRAYLAQTIFNDDHKREVLNSLVHPRVGEDFRQWQEAHASDAYLIKEAALLFETGSYQQLDRIINVSAPEELRVRRVLMRDSHRDVDQVKAIMGRQWSDAEREKLADFTIFNDDRTMVVPAVLSIHQALLNAKGVS